MNSLFVIEPYRRSGTWVFDDARVGLEAEPFVAGIPEMMDRLVADIPDAQRGFRLIFAAQQFPGAVLSLERVREELGGWWYRVPAFAHDGHTPEGWLCPALFKYFDSAPAQIWVCAEVLKKESSL